MTHIFSYLCGQPWAIAERAMETILEISERRNDIEAVAAKLGKPLENTGGRVEMRGSTAVIEVQGPLFRYANLFTECSGATSIEMFARNFTAAVDNPKVESILLNINSPGGQADGVGEMAAMIRAATEKKPVVAYVGGLGASGGYWLGAAASRLVMYETAFVGSIGCVATVADTREREKKDGITKYNIVSSQSPRKRSDIATAEGQAEMQAMVDAMADVFIGRVAEYRGTTPKHVREAYGEGFVVDAKRALAAGMVDAIGSFESVLGALNQEAQGEPIAIAAKSAQGGTGMAEEKQPVVDTGAEAVKADRARINAILGCEEAKGREAQARHFALETDMSAEAARKALALAPQPQAAAPVKPAEPKTDALTEHMRKVENPKVGVGAESGDDEANEIRAIVGYLPANQRRTQ